MVTLKFANQARDLVADDWMRRGVHGLAVDKVLVAGKPTFALIAMVPSGHTDKLPDTVNVEAGGKRIDVPVVVRTTAPFKLE
ncbi:hypothetical protein BH09PSE5_BH09PSE5_38900 [soil metagenome]